VAEPWVLAVDLGTGGLKTGAVSLGGEILGQAFRSVETRYCAGGGATQDPAAWWAGVRDGVGEVLRAGAGPGDLVGVGITGQWGSTVPVDAEGLPAGDCLLWADHRGRSLSAKVLGGPVQLFGYSPGNVLRWVQLTGGAPSPSGADPLGHELFLRHRQPEVHARTRTFMEPLDYLGMRFTGRRAATPASMILSWLTDNRPGGRPGYVPALLRRSGRDASRLPELIPTGSVLGGIRPDVARELDLPAGVPVVAGVPDLHTAVVGSGAIAPFEAHLTIGTTAWIGCEVPFKRTDILHQVASVPGLRPGSFIVANNHETAGACLRWLRDSVIDAPDRLAGGRAATYDDLTGLAEGAPAGSGGVIFTPWLNGERSPVDDHSLRAAFLNVSMSTDRACLVRSVMEGVAYNARWLLDAVERFVRRPLPALRILGGGAASSLWCQVHADVLGRRIERVAEPMHANLRGAGLFAAMSLGRISAADVPGLVRVSDTYEPRQTARAVYEPVYREYARLYGRLGGLYARLDRIGGGAA
jgi:xylulokinase